jgi:ABC-type lipoprotein export system ATPase subunit
LNERKLTRLRAETFGYIFQKFYLIPTLNVMENIMLPFAFYKKKNLTRSAKDIADRLGISHRLNHLPREISGGEMQRVAIARALVNHPPILLADEPTGNLDSKRSQEIAEILNQLNQEDKITIILVTHNQQLAENANSIIELRDGQIL